MNPVTKQLVTLTALATPSNSGCLRLASVHSGFVCCGLACVCSMGDYKVVLVSLENDRCVVLVLTVGTDKPWRMINIDHLTTDDHSILSSWPMSGGSFIYWWCYSFPFDLTLDVETKRFYKVPVPKGCHVYCRKSEHLLDFRDVCPTYHWKLWALTDPKVGEWTELVSINLEAQKHILEDEFSVKQWSCSLCCADQ